ncbi:MAG TPA: archease [Pseudonocardiaceae bacterium]|jgi:SHS2 domain-containing protein|nr:archease [Pseudonocardiaceae bacterium]
MSIPAQQARQGHRTLPHTADLRIEAWAPTREACIAETVAGLVGSFADTTGAVPVQTVITDLAARTDEDALVAVLDEVIYRLDTEHTVPLAVNIEPCGTGVRIRLELTAVDSVEFTGAIPKAVTLHQLRLVHGPEGWSSAATVDV